ncbi:MAG: hypothetical protein M1330_04220 [Armatimonadetes bacterium]|nr:hypothetical protein [Armatimonadota bacterium]
MNSYDEHFLLFRARGIRRVSDGLRERSVVGAERKRYRRAIGEGATGFIQWRPETVTRIYTRTVILTDGTIYFSCDDNNLYAISKRPDGSSRRRNR